MAQTVSEGPFIFCTKAELDVKRLEMKASAPEYTRGLAGATVNGESFTFYHDGVEYTREEYGWHLLRAYNELGETKYGIAGGNRTAANFNAGAGGSGFPNWNC